MIWWNVCELIYKSIFRKNHNYSCVITIFMIELGAYRGECHMDSEEKFESHLRAARVRKGLTREQLSQEANVSTESIRKIEKGISVPNVLLALSLAALLGVAVHELFKPKKEGENADD